MRQVKICVICHNNIGENACGRCGSLVCKSCFSIKNHSCVNCLIGRVVNVE